MTDKIILDAVDVSGCELCLRICQNTKEPQAVCKLNGYCTSAPNCYYKQLKRKEEECEGLRHGQHVQNKVIKDLQEQLQAEKEKLEFLPYIEIRKEEEKASRIQLQEDNEKLNETIDGLLKVQYELAANCQKYTQALEEIKGITEVLIVNTPEYNNCYYKDECGDNCTPKKEKKIDVCIYEQIDKIIEKCEV